MISILAGLCFAGSFLAFALSTLGLFRLPDSYARVHGIGMGDTLGVGLAGLGLILLSPTTALQIKIAVILLIYWLINPTMSHLVGKAALMYGVQPVAGTKVVKR